MHTHTAFYTLWNRFKSTIFDYKFYFRFQIVIQTNKLGVCRIGNERLKRLDLIYNLHKMSQIQRI